jgi:hypothetical protein
LGTYYCYKNDEIFEVLTAVIVKVTVFWVVMACSLVDRFKDPEDGGSRFL